MGQAIIIMGVCGTGKTTVGEALAERLDCPFLEGDSYHPPENVEKMRSGTPLDDEDRWPWLDLLGKAMAKAGETDGTVIASCSALKRTYRDRLRSHAGEGTLFVLLDGARDLLQQRLDDRAHDYMPATLLDSQLKTLERPEADETALSLDVRDSAAELVKTICRSIEAA